MPTYDYECQACQHRYELFQSITAKPIRKCPECGQNRADRLIGTGASVIFKGSGFYETDYRSESYKKGAKAESDSKKSADDTTTSGDKTTAKSESTASTPAPAADTPTTPKKKKAE